MRLLADENVPRAIAEALRRQGHDVLRVVDAEPGADDRGVERLAAGEGRAILTFDKDFGDLAVRGRIARAGVVLLRFRPDDPAEAAALVVDALAKVGELHGLLVLVERDRVRIRPLPPTVVQ